MTYVFSAPSDLEETWESGGRSDPDAEMRPAFRDDIEAIRSMIDAGDPLVPVQGRISDWKSWMAVCLAQELSEDGTEVTVFAPQTANRETAVDRLIMFGSEYLEHAGRIDLCNWDEWREEVGRVDKKTCAEIPCPFYLSDEADIADRTAEALSGHMLETGMRIELDSSTMREMGREENQYMCPAQLYLSARGMSQTDGAVNAATYAKAFADAAISDDDPLDSDVAILDEAHAVATDIERVVEPVDPDGVRGSLDAAIAFLDSVPMAWADRAMDDLSEFSGAVGDWLRTSREESVSPPDLFEGRAVDLSFAFDLLDRIDGRLVQRMTNHLAQGNWGDVRETSSVYNATERLRGLLSHVHLYNEGAADFVHSRYEEGGEPVNSMVFRRVDERVDPGSGTTPGAVFEEWLDAGTRPAIEDRWGALLDRHIEALWDGRAVYPGGDVPGAPITPMGELRRISGADTLVALSATHNDLSDPTRDPGDLRPTRHKVLCAPVRLRAKGCDRDRFVGNRSVDPETPWFAEMVTRAAESTGEPIAAVPINTRNLTKWSSMPVVRLSSDGGPSDWGVVPNSRGSIGEKELESLEVDTVLCGIQAQGPAPTARRVVLLWETLAPRMEDPSAVLDASWRLLAQHVVSGTIQAGGRFDWGAVNLVFERPGLFDLAGFRTDTADAESPGFAGEFVRLFDREKRRWERDRDAARVKRTARYLEESDRKSPSLKQFESEYERVYPGEPARQKAREALGGGGARLESGGDGTVIK